ncbi:MAG TPA: DUF6186 family protein [Acidimicrobiales bacterium]
MTSRSITIAGFATLLVVFGVLELAARTHRVPLPTIDQAFGAVMRRPIGRITVFFVWFWFGWHFLARSRGRRRRVGGVRSGQEIAP